MGLRARAAPYEITGDVGRVVFPCGWVHDPETDLLRMYYGAADTVIGLATACSARSWRASARRRRRNDLAWPAWIPRPAEDTMKGRSDDRPFPPRRD